MEWLKAIAKHHDDWILMVNNFGELDLAEDIVQDAYLRLVKYGKPEKFIKDGKVSKGFMFVVLRNIHLDYCKQKHKLDIVRLSPDFQVEATNETERKEAQGVLDQRINEVVESWHWYDAMLFDLYRHSEDSYRTIASNTNISFMSIYNTVKNCKDRLREQLGEDYEDYLNKDYDRL